MHRFIAIAALLALAGCYTAQVQTSCQETQEFVARNRALIEAAPSPAVRAAGTAILTGAAICGSEEYADYRDLAVAWVRERAGR
jgi:hypothetical protein